MPFTRPDGFYYMNLLFSKKFSKAKSQFYVHVCPFANYYDLFVASHTSHIHTWLKQGFCNECDFLNLLLPTKLNRYTFHDYFKIFLPGTNVTGQ